MKTPEWLRPERNVRNVSISNLTELIEHYKGRPEANQDYLSALKRLLKLYKGGMKR